MFCFSFFNTHPDFLPLSDLNWNEIAFFTPKKKKEKITQGSLCNSEASWRNTKWSAWREGPCQQWGEGSRRRNAGSMDSATQSSFLSPRGSYLCRSRGIGARGGRRHARIFAYRCDGVSRNHSSPGTPNGLLISVPTVPPHETLQITSLTALNSPRLCRAYTQRRLIGTIHYMRAGLFQATGHSRWWMWMKAEGETEEEKDL